MNIPTPFVVVLVVLITLLLYSSSFIPQSQFFARQHPASVFVHPSAASAQPIDIAAYCPFNASYSLAASELPAGLLTRTDGVAIDEAARQGVFAHCQAFSSNSLMLGNLFLNSATGRMEFKDPRQATQDAHLVIRISPRHEHTDAVLHSQEIYIWVSNMFILHENVKLLSRDQQQRLRICFFISERFSDDQRAEMRHYLYNLFAPFTARTSIITTISGNQASYDYMINEYIMKNPEITLDTIVLFLEDDYVCKHEMLQDVLEFFASHDPCIIFPSDYIDRYAMNINDDDRHNTVVLGKTRHWRSVTSTTVTYFLRLRTFLAFRDDIMRPTDDWGASHSVRKKGGDTTFMAPLPGLCSHNEVATLRGNAQGFLMASPLVDWNVMSYRALRIAPQLACFPKSMKPIPKEHLLPE